MRGLLQGAVVERLHTCRPPSRSVSSENSPQYGVVQCRCPTPDAWFNQQTRATTTLSEILTVPSSHEQHTNKAEEVPSAYPSTCCGVCKHLGSTLQIFGTAAVPNYGMQRGIAHHKLTISKCTRRHGSVIPCVSAAQRLSKAGPSKASQHKIMT